MEFLTRLRLVWEQAKSQKKAPVLLMLLGGLGIILIFLSSLGKEPEITENLPQKNPVDRVAFQEELRKFIAKIDGAGETEVLLSFFDDGEVVYLKEIALDPSGSKEEYVLAGSSGRDVVEVSYRLPEIKGVAVLCEGGGDPNTCAAVIEAVATALGIGSHRVTVSKIAP